MIRPEAINMTVKMSFGAFWFHIDDEFFCGECLYSSGVLLIIITQLADNFDVISAACGGSQSLRVSCLQTWQQTDTRRITRP